MLLLPALVIGSFLDAEERGFIPLNPGAAMSVQVPAFRTIPENEISLGEAKVKDEDTFRIGGTTTEKLGFHNDSRLWLTATSGAYSSGTLASWRG